jgi:hypothetical protein
LRGDHRRIWIFVFPRSFKYIAAVDFSASEVTGFTGRTTCLFELVVVGLQIVIADGANLAGSYLAE